jgi:hypothetical protein
MLGRVVVHAGDNCVGSSVVHAPYVGLVEHGREGGDDSIFKPSLVDAPYDVF